MKLEWRTCIGAAVFLTVTAIVYWLWSREQTGTACLVFSVAAYGMIGSYMYLQYRRRKGIPRPEDNEYAEQSDGAGEIGFFPAASMWPPAMGIGAVFIALGTIYGMWYWVIGGALMLGGIIGYVVEAEAREEGPDDPGMPVDPSSHEHTPVTSESVPSAYER